jgi:hypothetical protein
VRDAYSSSLARTTQLICFSVRLFFSFFLFCASAAELKKTKGRKVQVNEFSRLAFAVVGGGGGGGGGVLVLAKEFDETMMKQKCARRQINQRATNCGKTD